MFRKFDEPTELDEATYNVFHHMKNMNPTLDDHNICVDQLTKLYKLKEIDSKPRVSPDTLALLGANILGIVLIVGHERANVITSKALSFITKLK